MIAPVIPYIEQSRTGIDRTCGAAALAMAARSFGIECDPGAIWPRVSVARRRGPGPKVARTHLLARCATELGLDALVVQAARPWETLLACQRAGIRAIINHRTSAASTEGHYSVLAGIDDDLALLHDPGSGPAREIERDALLALWRPFGPHSEIAGNVLIAVSKSTTFHRCGICGNGPPGAVECWNCNASIALRPATAIGCLDPKCSGRLFAAVYCLNCDSPLLRC